MKRVAFFIVLIGVVAIMARPSAMIPEQVRVDTGLLAGNTGSTQPTVRVFKGIPFAAPPLGENRWRAPQPAAKWDGVRKADAFGAPCTAGPHRGPAEAAERPPARRRAAAAAAAPRTGAQRRLPLRQRLDECDQRRTTSVR